MIYTFYSYKGGVGRSMALAAVARALALRGLRVLVVDFDLEAPGLERYFYDDAGSASRRAEPGLIDLIGKYREALSDEAAFSRAEFQQLDRFQLSAIHSAGTRGGSVDLLSAGRRASVEQMRDYALTVRNFDWQDFFHHWKGDRFFDWLRRRWTDPQHGYQVVLVDSRTGVTEMGGVCAYQLADAVVLLSAPNAQNLEGTRDVARDFVSDNVRALRRGRPLQTLAIPARLAEKHSKREAFLKDFAREMGVLGMPKVLADAKLTYERLALRFDADLSVGEMSLGQAGPGAPAAPTSRPFAEDIERLASALLLLADPDGPLKSVRAEALVLLGGGEVDRAAALEADPTKASAGYDVYIDFADADADAARMIDELLRARGIQTFFDLQEAGSAWADPLKQALSYSANLLVLFGRAALKPWRERLLAEARRQRIRIVPVLLPGAEQTILASYGLDDALRADLRQGIGAGKEDFDALVEGLRLSVSSSPSDSEVSCPFPGNRPFGESDTKRFFGRTAEVEQAASLLDKVPIVLLQGPAQVGKTSLVLAGLLPHLRGREVATLRSHLFIDARDDEWPQLPNPGAWPKGTDGFDLVVVDQVDSFERGPDVAERTRRLNAIASTLKQGMRRRLIAIQRESFPSVPDESTNVAPPVSAAGSRAATAGASVGTALGTPPDRTMAGAAVLSLAPLSAESMRQALEHPARGAGQLFEPGLIERLIESAGGARNAIAQIQPVLLALWERRRRGWLTNQGLDELGHLGGAFSERARALLTALEPPKQAAAGALLMATLTAVDSSAWMPRLRPWDRLATLGAVRALGDGAVALRDHLVASALFDLGHNEGEGMVFGPVRPDARVYVEPAAHERGTAFLRWRQSMESELLLWRSRPRREAAALLQGRALHEAREWLQREPLWLLADEVKFIDASVARHVVAVPKTGADSALAAVEAVSGRDVVVLEIEDGTSLSLHPETVRELMQANDERGGHRADLRPVGGDSGGPAALSGSTVTGGSSPRGASGGFLGSVVLKSLQVLTAGEPPSGTQTGATLRKAEGAPGIVALGDAAKAWPDVASTSVRITTPRSTRALVLIPGTLFGGEATFGGLWRAAPAVWSRIAAAYPALAFGFTYGSLSEDPIDAAMRLALACAPQARLDLLTHGAGGLVAEVLVRATASGAPPNPGDSDFSKRFAGLASAVRTRRLEVRRVVRVACPARGLPLVARRFDVFLSLLAASAQRGGATLAPPIKALILTVARVRLDPVRWPGSAVMQPDSALMRWLPATDEPVASELRVIAGVARAEGAMGWLNTLAGDSFYADEGDGVVPARSMFGGVPRLDAGRFIRIESARVHHFGYFSDPAGVKAIADALLLDDPPGFHAIGPYSFAGDSATGVR